MHNRALAPIALLLGLALAGCSDEGTEPTAAAASSSTPMTLECGPEGEPPVELESVTLERLGDDLRLTWTANAVPPATGSYAANIFSGDGGSQYMVVVEFPDGETPTPGATAPNAVWAEPSRVITATYPMSAMPEIGSAFQWSATLAFSDGEGSLSQCPPAGAPVSYP